MATLQSNTFSSYELTPEEQLHGNILTQLQKQCIQNEIYLAAQEKLNLLVDPNNMYGSLQREAELQGKIRALQNLIIYSENAEISLKEASQQPAFQQSLNNLG